jgi:caa(3)-type oxidase subunit IV
MSENTEHAEHAGHEVNYIKIWAILLCLLVVSIAGPFLGIKIVTLITAFGIAIVKAYLVAKNFMHLNIEPRYAVYLLTTMLVFMLLFFAGVAPDVMKHEGRNWVKPAVHVETHAPAHH